MTIINCFTTNNEVTIHYLDTTEFDPELIPLVYIPGTLGFAEQFEKEMKELSPRRCLSISLRGNGKSDAPLTGYSLEDHVDDIQAVISESGLKDYCLLAYSMGVPFAITFASSGSRDINSLILGDYPARYPEIPEAWVENVLSRGFVSNDREHVVRNIQADSKRMDLEGDLSRIVCPVLLIKGGTEKSLLKENEVEKYKNNVKHLSVVEFSDSGHELWEPDYQRFLKTITDFLDKD